MAKKLVTSFSINNFMQASYLKTTITLKTIQFELENSIPYLIINTKAHVQ